MAKGRKTGGRKPGSRNKRVCVLEICERMGLNPFEEMAKIAGNSIHDKQFDALKELCQYIEPKKKAVEVSGSLDPDKAAEIERLEAMDPKELARLAKEEAERILENASSGSSGSSREGE